VQRQIFIEILIKLNFHTKTIIRIIFFTRKKAFYNPYSQHKVIFFFNADFIFRYLKDKIKLELKDNNW